MTLKLNIFHKKKLTLDHPNLTTLYIYGASNLEEITLASSKNKIENLVIQHCSKLSRIDPAILSNLQSLSIKQCSNADLFEISHKLKYFELEIPKHTESRVGIPFQKLTEAEEVNFNNIKFEDFLFPTSFLKRLTLTDCILENLDLSKFPNLEELIIKDSAIKNYNFNAPHLKKLFLQSKEEFTIDCALLPELQAIKVIGEKRKLLNWPPRKVTYGIQTASTEATSTPKKTRSRLNPEDDVSLDHETGKANPYVAQGDLEFELYDREGGIVRNKQRLSIYDHIHFNKGKITFSKTHSMLTPVRLLPQTKSLDEAAPLLKKEVEKNDETEMGHFSGKNIQPGLKIPFVSSHSLDKDSLNPADFYFKPPDAKIELYYDDYRKQYFFQLAPGEKTKNIEVLYRIKKNPDYLLTKKTDIPVLEEKNQLLPIDLQRELKKKIQTNKAFHFLIDDSIPVANKLEQLLAYFKAPFEEKKLPRESNIDTLWKIITEHVGVCRHKSEAFVTLAQFINVPARLVRNGVHEYVEVPYQSPKPPKWIGHDLGGADMLDLTTDLISQLDKIPSPSLSSSSSSSSSPILVSDEEKRLEALFQSILNQQIIDSLSQLLETKNPLIELKPGQTPIATAAYLFKKCQEEKKYSPDKIIYIHEPSDFKLYLDTPFVDGSHAIKNIRGPLHTLIRDGGVIIVNWDNFPPDQLLIYKSMLDDKPILGKYPITSPDCKVIGLTAKTHEDQAFLSRCTSVTLPSIHIPETKSEEKKEALTTVEMDLFELPSWRSDLLGTLKLTKEGIRIEKETLIDAMTHADQLIIKNPPKDSEFDALVEQIKQGLPLFHNGRWIPSRKEFAIILKDEPSLLLKDIKNIHIATSEEKSTRQKMYLGLYNFLDCFSQTLIEEGKPLQTKPGGFLTDFNSEENTFYITESIPQYYWLKLLKHIQDNYPEKKFHFTLAPGVEIKDVAKNASLPTTTKWTMDAPLPMHTRIITSNDPDLCSMQLAKEFKDPPLIIHVTPETTFADLMADMKISDEGLGHYQEKGLLSALLARRNVILNGDLSPFLYQNLLPLLSVDPHIHFNGKRISPSGQLFLVTANKPNLANTIERKYRMGDYKRLLHEEDPKKLENIHMFYYFAQKWPHRGKNRPKEPLMSFQRVKNMVNALKTKYPLHQNNPIKGLFLYDYPRYSNDYAYLNVISKFYFSPEMEKLPRDKKLKKWWDLCTTEDKIKEHAWQLLNCFSGPDIRAILGRPHNIIIENGYPTLPPDALSKLITKIRAPKIITKKPAEKKSVPSTGFTRDEIKFVSSEFTLLSKTKHIKTSFELPPLKNKFEKLLANPNKPIIFLKGTAGTGKTHLVEQLDNVFDGDEKIIDWLTDTSDQPKILTLDEGNMLLPGTLNFLKGLTFGQNEIYYAGKKYDIIPGKHKVIITGNPENYPNRYYHQLIQDHAETFYLSKPSREQLRTQILPHLTKLGTYAEKLLDAGELIEEHNHFFDFTRREATNLAFRFKVLVQEAKATDLAQIDQLLLKACVSELSGSIKDISKRKSFEKALSTKLSITPQPFESKSPLITISPDYSLPIEKLPMLTAIEQDLMIRDYALREMKKERPYKKIVLLEGAPGVGKTSLFLELMKKENREYVHIVAGAPDAREAITDAIKRGVIILLDELNADKSLEKFIIGLEKTLNTSNSLILASQNASTDAGRASVSEALRSRSHCIYVDKFENKELCALASDLPLPQLFVEKFLKSKLTMRTFFQKLQSEKALLKSKRPRT